MARAWIALSTGQLDDAAEWIEAAETRSGADGADDDAISAQVVVLRAVHSFKTAEVAAALEMARRATTLELGDAPLGRASAYCIYGSALYFSGSTDEARAAFLRALELAEKVGDRRARSYALGHLALISAEQGRLADAERQIRRASGSSRDLANAEHLVDVMVSLATAELLRVRGDAAAAAAAADMAVMSARQGGAILEVAKALLSGHRSSSISATTRPRRPPSKRPVPWCAIARTLASPRGCSLRPGRAAAVGRLLAAAGVSRVRS